MGYSETIEFYVWHPEREYQVELVGTFEVEYDDTTNYHDRQLISFEILNPDDIHEDEDLSWLTKEYVESNYQK